MLSWTLPQTVAIAFLLLASLCLAQSGQRPGAIEPQLQPFNLARVRLLDGPCKTAQEANREYLHRLDADRLLHSFRINAGLDAPGEPLGGWEAPQVEVRGHFVGHYLSACAMTAASCDDFALQAKADYMVAELAACQQALEGGYLAAYPATFFDRLESLVRKPWAPYYTIHKIMAGMYDMYTVGGNDQALDVLKPMADYFGRRMDKLSIPRIDEVLKVEFGGMSEVLHNLYAVTGDPEHLRLAHTFDRAAFLGPLALEHDNLTGLHANTHIPEVQGAARRYELTGDRRYRTIATYFWDRVVNTRSYATGGSNLHEHWPAPNALADTLGATNQESCTTHNMLKLTRYLIRWTGHPRYADFYERAFFNGVLGTQNPQDGMLSYFMPLGTGYTKKFGTPYDSFWCCYGTGIEAFSKLGNSIYFHDGTNLYVNLFIASRLQWDSKGVTIEQRTQFPEQEGTELTVHLDAPASFAINVHVPYWAAQGVEVAVNDEPLNLTAAPTSYLAIERQWHDGDRIHIDMPMSLHTEPMPDDPDLAAIMYGPLVLAGLTDVPRYFLADIDDPQSWIQPVEEQPLTFRTIDQKPNMTFVPLYRVIDEKYGVYWVITEEGSRRHKQILAQQQAQRQREARIIDRVLPNDPEGEKAHNLQGENTAAGDFRDKSWRHATNGGWFSWDLKVLPDVQNTLLCTYWGSDYGARSFDVLIDGEKIGTMSLDRSKPDQFFNVEYPIPRELTDGHEEVTVRFQAHPENMAGGVFECATLRPAE